MAVCSDLVVTQTCPTPYTGICWVMKNQGSIQTNGGTCPAWVLADPGEVVAPTVEDPIGDSLAIWALGLVLLAGIWSIKRVYHIFNKE